MKVNDFGRFVVGGGIAAMLASVGCGGPRMVVPSGFDRDMDRMSTKGRGRSVAKEEEFGFGPYLVSNVDHTWKPSKGFEMIDGFKPSKESGYRFDFSGGGKRALVGKCALPAREKHKEIDGSVSVEEQKSAVACTCQMGTKSRGYLFVEDLAGEYDGPVVVGDVEVNATGIYKLENEKKVKVPVGFRLDDDNGPVAAVEILPGKARVWMRSDLKKADRPPLACLLSGLMLYDPPKVEEKKDKRQ